MKNIILFISLSLLTISCSKDQDTQESIPEFRNLLKKETFNYYNADGTVLV